MVPTIGAAGIPETVNSFVFRQLLLFLVYVRITMPGESAVTTPLLVIEATDGLLLVQVPWDVGLMLTVLPTQAKSGPLKTGVLGMVSINTDADEAETQPSCLLTVKL